ncbi:hypothetical protein FZC75_05100 [Sutcliffiella horikoshii]|uniref:Uncharacterized protein n=1 Tax=Sutcliffiella horikoshii TaxID=79883 RepID=A0A5D4TD74_9BACI|nr:hypothetical protein FZC75_05100 [Sutcliffiella horikoshii]
MFGQLKTNKWIASDICFRTSVNFYIWFGHSIFWFGQLSQNFGQLFKIFGQKSGNFGQLSKNFGHLHNMTPFPEKNTQKSAL